MTQRHYTKRIAKSEKRAHSALNLFNIAASTLEAEAQEQAEVHALVQAERLQARVSHAAQVQALADAHEQLDNDLAALQARAEAHGRRAQDQAIKLRELFL